MQVKDYNDGAWHLSWLEGGVYVMEGGTERMMSWKDRSYCLESRMFGLRLWGR